ncbi:MAG TPA: tRNA 2-selenouridine(34) synthase MnmH [Casimicrobiaceae bacterium]|nr:tRNA 2-selenouridine(34) synthase MnmH [Casimicrobiaceae bacterium]
MSAHARSPRAVGVDALAAHADRLDVRSPAEYADDHLPGAISCPVLDDDERARVGTLHAQAGAFEAKKVGAALVSRRIAAILETVAADKPRGWSPLVYCWRGGKRSASLTHVLNEIGFPAVQLDGGYRAWRRHVVARLAERPTRFDWRVVCGVTGSGKSRLLAALAAEGGQVLDLESLAHHRGSLLGDRPGEPQPSQKAFESAILGALDRFDARAPVWVESESRRIGSVQVPDAVLAAMRAARCVALELTLPQRVALLMEDYAHFLADPEALASRLAHLVPLHGRATIERWSALARERDFDTVVAELLVSHYDPTYTRAMSRNYPGHASAPRVSPDSIDPRAWRTLARSLLAVPDR